jgi:hypothetical protein
VVEVVESLSASNEALSPNPNTVQIKQNNLKKLNTYTYQKKKSIRRSRSSGRALALQAPSPELKPMSYKNKQIQYICYFIKYVFAT